MKRPQIKLVTFSVIAATAAMLAPVAQAETVLDVATPFSAGPRIDFRIIIPAFLRFRVGTAGATVDQITFDMTAIPGNVGNSTPVAGTGGDALLGTGANVVVQGNNGQITITETNNSATLGLGTGVPADGFINYSQITTTPSDPVNFPAPTLSNATSNTALPVLNAGRVTDRTATWSYAYLNTTTPSAGTYGTVANGGQVTYTATMP